MARPLPPTSNHPNGTGGNAQRWADAGATRQVDVVEGGSGSPGGKPKTLLSTEEPAELDLQEENAQLRALCIELEQALQEATQQNAVQVNERVRTYEALIEEKDDMIRQFHQELHNAQVTVAELESQLNQVNTPRVYSGPAPREEELLALSEELERERRQLQEDEQTLMDQMREMEVGMAKERAEMARQRNDLQRLQAEIRHELERLERNGALQNKMADLKSKLHDATTRRGMSPGSSVSLPPVTQQQQQPAQQQPQQPAPPAKKEGSSLMGRLFGNK
jgi:hypothetical protein